MEITKKLQTALRKHRDKKPELAGKNVRIRIGGSELSVENFDIGFDGNDASESDKQLNFENLTVVMDPKTAKLLIDAQIDIDEGGISISFDN